MRICLVSSAYYPYPSGVSEHVHYLGVELRARGHQVEILTSNYDARSEPRSEPGVTRLGRVLKLRGYGSYTTLPVGFRLSGQVRKFLDAGRFDIVHTHGLFPPELAYWAVHHSHSPVVVTFHTTGMNSWRPLAAAFRVVFARDLRKLVVRIAVSQAARDNLLPFVPGEYEIVPNGIDTVRFSPSVAPLRRAPDGQKRILYVGRLDERKGLPVLLHAFSKLRAQGRDLILQVIGHGPMLTRCRRLAIELGVADCVEFMGYASREEVPMNYAGADICCFPTLGGEAFGIVLLEAMASGKPVVATDIEGYREVVDNGVNGLLARPADADATAKALAAILDDDALARKLSSNGRNRALEFAWPKVTDQVEALYLRAVSGSRA